MKGYSVYLTRVSDGVISKMHYDYEWENDFWWSEGNMACDCNRYLEFERGLGNEPDFDKCGCSDYKYIIRVVADNGEELYTELIGEVR